MFMPAHSHPTGSLTLSLSHSLTLSLSRCHNQRNEQSAAAAVLQRWWRSVSQMQVQRAWFRRACKAVVVLQSFARMHLERTRYQRTIHATVCLQSHVRRWLAQRVLGRLRAEYAAAVVLQKHVRGCAARRTFRRVLTAHREQCAAVAIQRCARGFLVRRNMHRCISAATAIQAAFRGHVARRGTAMRLHAVAVLQRRLRATLQARQARAAFLHLRRAAVVVQDHWRCRQTLRKTRAVLAMHRRAATVIQSAARMWACVRERRARMHAIVVLQTNTRAWLSRRTLLRLRQERNAAVALQAVARGFALRLALTRHLEFRAYTAAATCIQTHVRGWLVRSRYNRLRAAAICLQARVRGAAARRTTAQRVWAVHTLQARVRAVLTGRRERAHFVRLKAAAVTLQRMHRLRVDARFTRQLCAVRRNACVVLQRNWRMAVARRRYVAVRSAVVCLQARVRGMQARAAVQHMRERERITRGFAFAARTSLAAMAIQRAWRKHALQTRAAICLQAAVRGWLCRRAYAQTQHAAITIQKHVRGALVRRAYVQWRLDRVQRLCTATHVFLSAVVIQRAWRKHAMQTRAAICLQAAVRGHLARTRAARKRAAVLCVQSHWRRVLATREVKKQRLVAERRARVLLLGARMFLAAVVLQRRVRAMLGKQRRERAAIVIQRRYREWHAKHSVAVKHTAATRIQACFRAYRTRKNMSSRLRRIYKNVQEVNKAYCPEATLGWKTNSALMVLLKYKKVSKVLEALKNLNAMAKLTIGSCERIAKHDGLEVIYTLIRSCNRSKPEMAMVVHCLSIIESLLQHRTTAHRVLKNKQLGELMFDLTRGYRDNSDIFEPACRLLHKCCQQDGHRQRLKQDRSYMKRLRSLINMTEVRKQVTCLALSLCLLWRCCSFFLFLFLFSSLLFSSLLFLTLRCCFCACLFVFLQRKAMIFSKTKAAAKQ